MAPVFNSIVDVQLATGGAAVEDTGVWMDFEMTYPKKEAQEWFMQNRHYCFYLAGFYIALTFTGRRLMRDREPFRIRGILFVWNIVMAIFSGFIAARGFVTTARKLYYSSFYGFVCDIRYLIDSPQLILWGHVFTLSKSIEFLDTVFIVLKKQPLHFIHWYHHATVVIQCWHIVGAKAVANSLIYTEMNSLIHAFMYTFYAAKTLRWHVPRFVNIAITTMQICQMFVGVIVNSGAAYYHFLRPHDRPCDDDTMQILVSSSIYSTYLFLFCRFFYQVYIRPSPPTPKKTK